MLVREIVLRSLGRCFPDLTLVQTDHCYLYPLVDGRMKQIWPVLTGRIGKEKAGNRRSLLVARSLIQLLLRIGGTLIERGNDVRLWNLLGDLC